MTEKRLVVIDLNELEKMKREHSALGCGKGHCFCPAYGHNKLLSDIKAKAVPIMEEEIEKVLLDVGVDFVVETEAAKAVYGLLGRKV